MWSLSSNSWTEEGGTAKQSLAFPGSYQSGNSAFGTGMFSNLENASLSPYEPWKSSAQGPGMHWPACCKDRDEDDVTTDYTMTQKSSAGSSCGDDDWNSSVRSNLAGEFIPGDPFGFSEADTAGGLVDVDPEVGRQRGQELLAMLSDGPLSKGHPSQRDSGHALRFGPPELLSTAMPQSRQTFSQPWIPLGTAFAQGNRPSHPNGFAL
ncbi:unnamed protein product [Effrenium voratum]|nr:unnamed protein product [Effrenium voratum]